MLTFSPFLFTEEYDDKQPLTSKEEEERRIAEMGRPILGEHTKLEVIIEESYEFKVSSPALPLQGHGGWGEEHLRTKTVHRFSLCCMIYRERRADVTTRNWLIKGPSEQK